MLRWLKGRFYTYDLVGDYFIAVKSTGWDLLWGASIPSIAYCLWWFKSVPPWWVTMIFLLALVFVSGYYLWRADHVRLMPQFAVKSAVIQPTETESPEVMNMFIQIIPECLTEAPVYECRGRLLRVCRRFTDNSEWAITPMDAPLFLGWDYYGHGPFTLEPGINQRLNVCWWRSDQKFIIPSVEPLPSKFRVVFSSGDTYKFDIRITAKDCSPVDISVTVNLGLRKWDDPIVTLSEGGHSATKAGRVIGISSNAL